MKRTYDTKLIGRLIFELDLDKKEIDNMSRHEIFEAILDYEGYVHCAGQIKEIVREVYRIDLDHWQDYLAPESVAEMEGLEEY